MFLARGSRLKHIMQRFLCASSQNEFSLRSHATFRTLLDPPFTAPSQSTSTSSSLLFFSNWTPIAAPLFGRCAEQSPHTDYAHTHLRTCANIFLIVNVHENLCACACPCISEHERICKTCLVINTMCKYSMLICAHKVLHVFCIHMYTYMCTCSRTTICKHNCGNVHCSAKTRTLLGGKRGRHQNGQEKQNLSLMWKNLTELVDLEEPIPWPRVFGKYPTCMQIEREYYCRTQEMFESLLSAGTTEKLLGWEETSRKNSRVVTRYGRTCEKCVERHCELANKKTGQLYNVSTLWLDDHNFKKENRRRLETCPKVCWQVVLKCLYVARIGRFDMLTCTSCHKMDWTLWQTLSSFDILHSSHEWPQTIAMWVIWRSIVDWDCS